MFLCYIEDFISICQSFWLYVWLLFAYFLSFSFFTVNWLAPMDSLSLFLKKSGNRQVFQAYRTSRTNKRRRMAGKIENIGPIEQL